MVIRYSDDTSGLLANQLLGFFADWPNCPNTDKHLAILKNSYKVQLAFDGQKCVGFINALSDGVFYAYIPLLEVLPEYQGRGIGTELIQRMVSSLNEMYAIDIVCDESLVPFYKAKGFSRCLSMVKRNYENQG